jgi:cobalt-zinc-cadmium efflux system outer membrane protein
LALVLDGCARFQPQPLAPDRTAADFESRSLTNPDLRAFLETNHVAGEWPRASWDLNALALVSFYYHPDLAVARARWAVADAARVTAGERPNPSVSFAPTYDTTTPPPWILGVSFDVPIETAGKRSYRLDQAEHLSEAARWNFVSAAWQVRSRTRASLLGLYAASQTEALLSRQVAAQSNVVRLLEGQYQAGNVSEFDVTQARIALDSSRLAFQSAQSQQAGALAQLAQSLGLPVQALADARFSYAGLSDFPQALTATEVRRQAILSRADVRGALAEYAASQSALQLEIAKQYPDIHLGPGYELDQTDNKWTLGLSVTLPVLNQNQGGIAEARARREEAAASFLSVQATAIGEIDRALAGYRAALEQSATAAALQRNSQKRLESIVAMQQAGEVDALAVANARVEYNTGALSQLDAVVRAQQALGQLEDAVQSPLELPEAALRDSGILRR